MLWGIDIRTVHGYVLQTQTSVATTMGDVRMSVSIPAEPSSADVLSLALGSVRTNDSVLVSLSHRVIPQTRHCLVGSFVDLSETVCFMQTAPQSIVQYYSYPHYKLGVTST